LRITDTNQACFTKCPVVEYRKLSFFSKIQPIQKSNLTLTPTTLRWEVDVGVDDYRKKQRKKAEPNDPAFVLHCVNGNFFKLFVILLSILFFYLPPFRFSLRLRVLWLLNLRFLLLSLRLLNSLLRLLFWLLNLRFLNLGLFLLLLSLLLMLLNLRPLLILLLPLLS